MINTYPSLSLPLVLSIPPIAIALPLSIKTFYNTTITSKYVLNLVTQKTNFLTPREEQPGILTDQGTIIEASEMSLTCRYRFFNTPLKIQTALVAGAAMVFGAACFFGLKNIEIETLLPSKTPKI